MCRYCFFLALFFTFSIQAQIPCVSGTVTYNGIIYDCDNVDFLYHFSADSLGGPGANGNDIWGWTDLASGREFAIVGFTTGTAFVEVTDPLAPVHVGFLPSASNNSSGSSWRDMKVYQHYVYIVSEQSDHGIQIFDLNNLLSPPSIPTTFSADADFMFRPLGGNSHNIVQFPEANLVILVGSSGGINSPGLEFFDVTNPLAPTLVGGYNGDGYSHDAVCFIYRGPDSDYAGKEICIGSNVNVQSIVDVTDKFSPNPISTVSYYNPDTLPYQSGINFYTHQGWVSDDHRFVFFNDEYDEFRNGYTTRTHVMNIEDLDNAYYMGFYDHGIPSIDHNCYVKGNYVYMSNYTSGLRILDFSNLSTNPSSQITTAGFFDTYYQGTSRSFNGTWSNYPFFTSGTIVVNDINNGLFLLRQSSSQAFFTLQAKTEVQQVCQGDDLVIGVKSLDYGSNPGNVTLSASGLPSGSTAAFTDPIIGSDDSTTLVISNLPVGSNTYSIVISGNATGGSDHDLAFAFQTIIPVTNVTLSSKTFTTDTIITSSQSILLSGIVVSPGVDLQVFTPNLQLQNEINLKSNSTLHWVNGSVCDQN